MARTLFICLVLAAGTAAPLWAERKNDNGPEQPSCDEGLEADLRVVTNGFPLKGGTIQLSAALSKVRYITGTCHEASIYDIPSGVPFTWTITAPLGASPTLTGANTLAPTLSLPVSGNYGVRFTLCPGGCDFPAGGRGPLPLEPSSVSITVAAVESITIPPEKLPAVPRFANSWTNPTAFPWSDRQVWCLYGGGLVDPQWVSVNEWNGIEDYVFAEGVVYRAKMAHKDSFLNHDSVDFNFAFRVDPRYNTLLSTEPEHSSDRYLLGGEWERARFPEHVWPSVGDRVSVFGYWIFDCGHGPFYTEIHPIVGAAVQRPRPVRIPDGARVTYNCPPRGAVTATVGTNVWVPGIITDVWFNAQSGEVTSNCSDTGLHQKAHYVPDPLHPGQQVLFPGECVRGPAPLHRQFEFNIFLPRSPQLIYAEAGFSKPEVPLYLEISQVASLPQQGPDPVVELIPRSATNDHEYLRVRLDLSGFTGEAYSRRITAAWAFPSADNWGLRSWRVSLPTMDIHDDSDWNGVVFDNDGDWRFYMNLQNSYQEWTRIFDCDGCAHGHETFSPPFSTGASDTFFFRSLNSIDPQHRLGPDVLLYPEQRIRVHTSGYEEDCIFHDDTGTVNAAYTQAAQDPTPRSSGDDGQYTLNLQIREGPAVGQATPSADARSCVVDPYRLTNGLRPPWQVSDLAVLAVDINPGISPGRSARPPWKVDGDESGAMFGQAVAGAGDVNGDGYADVLVGAPLGTKDARGEGLAFLYLAHRDGLSSEPNWTGQASQSGASYGFAVAGAGDVNGDGFADVLVGAPTYDNGGTIVKLPPGRAFLHLGSPAGPGTAPAWQSSGVASLGFSVASAGDVNGDGFDDVLVGAPNATVLRDLPFQGFAALFLGSKAGLSNQAAWSVLGERANSKFGWSVASAGDVNGDGLSDVIVGAPEFSNGQPQEGKVYLFLGEKSAAGLSREPAWSRESNESSALLGYSVAGAGDVNGDGVSDIIVGMPGYFFDDVQTGLGLAQVFAGDRGKLPSQQPLWSLSGPTGGARMGAVVGSAGDLDGDGISDIIVSAPGINLGEQGEGAVYAFLGALKGPAKEPAWQVEGDQANAKLGTAAAPVGDINRDGFADVVIGAPNYDPPFLSAAPRDPNYGRVYAMYGWGPKEFQVVRLPAFEPDEIEVHSLVNVPLEDIVDLFAKRGGEAKVKNLHQAFLAEFKEALNGPHRADVIDEIATLHAAFPEALWKQYFGAYQLFRRGDSNADRNVDVSDGIFTLNALFGGGSFGCQDAADANDDGRLDISDPIATFGFLFLGASKAPPYPFEEAGLDPTQDVLGCARY